MEIVQVTAPNHQGHKLPVISLRGFKPLTGVYKENKKEVISRAQALLDKHEGRYVLLRDLNKYLGTELHFPRGQFTTDRLPGCKAEIVEVPEWAPGKNKGGNWGKYQAILIGPNLIKNLKKMKVKNGVARTSEANAKHSLPKGSYTSVYVAKKNGQDPLPVTNGKAGLKTTSPIQPKERKKPTKKRPTRKSTLAKSKPKDDDIVALTTKDMKELLDKYESLSAQVNWAKEFVRVGELADGMTSLADRQALTNSYVKAVSASVDNVSKKVDIIDARLYEMEVSATETSDYKPWQFTPIPSIDDGGWHDVVAGALVAFGLICSAIIIAIAI